MENEKPSRQLTSRNLSAVLRELAPDSIKLYWALFAVISFFGPRSGKPVAHSIMQIGQWAILPLLAKAIVFVLYPNAKERYEKVRRSLFPRVDIPKKFKSWGVSPLVFFLLVGAMSFAIIGRTGTSLLVGAYVGFMLWFLGSLADSISKKSRRHPLLDGFVFLFCLSGILLGNIWLAMRLWETR